MIAPSEASAMSNIGRKRVANDMKLQRRLVITLGESLGNKEKIQTQHKNMALSLCATPTAHSDTFKRVLRMLP